MRTNRSYFRLTNEACSVMPWHCPCCRHRHHHGRGPMHRQRGPPGQPAETELAELTLAIAELSEQVERLKSGEPPQRHRGPSSQQQAETEIAELKQRLAELSAEIEELEDQN